MRNPRALQLAGGARVGLMLAALMGRCANGFMEDGELDPPPAPLPTSTAPMASWTKPDCEVTLALASSVEKLPQMQDLARRYNRSRKCSDKALVDVFDAGPASVLDGLAGTWKPGDHNNRPRPDAWSPNASLSVDILRSRAEDLKKPNPVASGSGWSLNTTPMVLAVPEPIATRLVEKLGPISWRAIFDLAQDPSKWERIKEPEWGPLRFGKTNPQMSTMGLQTFVAEFAYAADRADPSALTEPDVGKGTVRNTVAEIEANVPHYAATSLDFLCNLARADQKKRALDYVTMVPVEEKSVIEYNAGKQTTGQGTDCKDKHLPTVPLVPLYPTDGLFLTDSPLTVLATATPAQRLLAEDFAAFVQTANGQRIFQDAGFRSIHQTLDHSGLAAYTDGLQETITPQKLPPPKVIKAVRDAWDDARRPARVVLLLDMSRSMRCKVDDTRDGDTCVKSEGAGVPDQRFALARDALTEVLDAKLLGPNDRVATHTLGEPRTDGSAVCRHRTKTLVPAAQAATQLPDWTSMGSDTPLYQCVTEAQQWLAAQPDSGKYINAVVVLTDGENDYPGMSIEQAEKRLRDTYTRSAVRVFPVAYVYPKLNADLGRLASAAEGTLRLANDASEPGTSARKINLILAEVLSNF